MPAKYPASQSQSQLRASSLVVREALQTDEPVTFATELRGVYPNPFNPVTTVSYALREEDHVSLVVYNVLGQRVAVLVDGVQAAGEHTITLDGNRLPSGGVFFAYGDVGLSANPHDDAGQVAAGPPIAPCNHAITAIQPADTGIVCTAAGTRTGGSAVLRVGDMDPAGLDLRGQIHSHGYHCWPAQRSLCDRRAERGRRCLV